MCKNYYHITQTENKRAIEAIEYAYKKNYFDNGTARIGVNRMQFKITEQADGTVKVARLKKYRRDWDNKVTSEEYKNMAIYSVEQPQQQTELFEMA